MSFMFVPQTKSLGYAFTPASLALTGWWREYPGGVTWKGLPSAGVSGSETFASAGAGGAPPAGTALNGQGVASFDGTTNQYLIADGTLDTYINGTAVSGWAVMYLDSSASTGTANIFGTDAGGTPPFWVALDGAGHLSFTLNFASSASKAFTTGVWFLLTFRYDGAHIQIGINEAPGASGGATSAAFTSAITPLTANMVLGDDAGVASAVMQIAEFGISDTVLSDSDFANIKGYVNTRYGLSL